VALYRNACIVNVPPPEPPPGSEAHCACGWYGGIDAGFVHQREHRHAITFNQSVDVIANELAVPDNANSGLPSLT
jgi:hypothetical protein